jgi:predicted adenine nucleotide alpha hydrolase (AANH) superfamily ATPase
MSNELTMEQCKAAKRYCWEMYSYRTWFCGCVYAQDEEKHVIGVEIRVDPAHTDRFTFVSEHEGVPISVVDWDPEKHGERYKWEKQ